MIFVIHNTKYDTDKMERIAEVKKWYPLNSSILNNLYGREIGRIYDCALWRSSKGNWLLTHEESPYRTQGQAIGEDEARELLMQYALDKYESLFGCLEEA